MTKIIHLILLTVLICVPAFSEENNSSTSTVSNSIKPTTFFGLSKQEGEYAPVLKNDQNLSVYRWNALETKWVNAYAVLAIALDTSTFSQDDASIAHVGDQDPFEKGDVRAIRIGAVGTINFDQPWTWVIAGATRSWDQGFDTDSDESFTFFDVAIGIPSMGRLCKVSNRKNERADLNGTNYGNDL